MNNIINDTIIVNNMLSAKDQVLVALSGGPDSVALLYCLRELAAKYDIKLFIAHLNHGLRAEESDREQQFCEKLGKKLNVPVWSNKIAGKELTQSEDTFRKIRYQFLTETAKRVGANKIAMAHHADDQIETVLMRLVRGTGTKGLGGIPPVRNLKEGIFLIRPLINVWRADIINYLKKGKIAFLEDSSNYSPLFTRNRIRHQLLPELAQYNPNIKETLRGMANTMTLVEDFLAQETKKQLKMLKKLTVNRYQLPRKIITQIHPAVAQCLIRKIISQLSPNKTLTYKETQQIMKLASSGCGTKQVICAQGITIRREYNQLFFIKGREPEKTGFQQVITVPGKTTVNEHNIFISSKIKNCRNIPPRVIKRPGNELFRFCQEKTLKFRAELDYDRINGPLIIRSRKSGDKYQPIGQSGRKSLKNILIDNKIPTIYRDKMPIVEENSDICWLVGYRIGANFSVKNKTKRVLNLTVEIK